MNKYNLKKAFTSFELAIAVTTTILFSAIIFSGSKIILNKTNETVKNYQEKSNINSNNNVEIAMSDYVIFDGIDDRMQTSQDSFRGIDPFTVVFLVKPKYTGRSYQLAAKPHSGRCTTAIATAIGSNGTISMSLDNFTGAPYCTPYRNLGGWTGATGTIPIEWDEVNLIAFKGYYFDFTLYVNGLEETITGRDNGYANAGNSVWNIGSSWNIGNSLFEGEMYKFAVFNQRISKEILNQLRNLDNWEGQANLIHYIDFTKYYPPDNILDTVGGLTVEVFGDS